MYEYLYSHQLHVGHSPLDDDNSNINLYLSCDPLSSSLGQKPGFAGFIRTALVDAEAGRPGTSLLFDLPLPSPADADLGHPILHDWVHMALSVSPRSARTFVNGLPSLAYGWHETWSHCWNNPAYPDPTALNTELGGFDLGDTLFVGGRSDLHPDRHFWGTMAGVAVYAQTISAAQVACTFADDEPHILPIPAAHWGCTDASATNFDAEAAIDDETCEYPPDQSCFSYVYMYEFDEEGQRVYPDLAWVDAAAEGVPLSFTSDDSFMEIALPFAFPFGGQSFERIAVADNGYFIFLTPGQPLPPASLWLTARFPDIQARRMRHRSALPAARPPASNCCAPRSRRLGWRTSTWPRPTGPTSTHSPASAASPSLSTRRRSAAPARSKLASGAQRARVRQRSDPRRPWRCRWWWSGARSRTSTRPARRSTTRRAACAPRSSRRCCTPTAP
jgi:hypothetical protein